MNERDLILGRIREALRHSPPSSHGSSPAGASWAPPAPDDYRRVLPATQPDFEARAALFHRNSEALRSEFHLLDGFAAVASALRDLARSEGWRSVATHSGGWSSPAAEGCGVSVVTVDRPGGCPAVELERCEAGVTECDALVAQTGSVIVSSRAAGGRALSVLPPHHVVLARRDQLLADLPAAFDLLRTRYGAGFPSMISFITGPSRTGDIERILVLGAHGPRRLTIFCG